MCVGPSGHVLYVQLNVGLPMKSGTVTLFSQITQIVCFSVFVRLFVGLPASLCVCVCFCVCVFMCVRGGKENCKARKRLSV